uniref:Uncharacterized protein n=1 Tax=Fagus sylvatica TaxID=28930 RepID=A0A2N9J2Q8_FAGSY
MTNLYFEIEIHSGGQFERNPELVYLGGKVSTYPKVDPDRLSYFEIQDIEGGVEPLQVVGQSDFGGVVDEGDEVEGDWMSTGDELEGDELQGDELNEGDVFGNAFEGDELNELVSYDWMNDGLKGADFADDIFGGNEDEDDNEVVGNGGDTASDAQSSMQAEVRDNGGNNASEGNNAMQAEVGDNGGNNASDAQPSMQAEVGSSGGNNASDAQPSMQPEVGSNGGNNAQPGVGSNEGMELQNLISETGMRKPDLVIGMKFLNSKVFREALREYVVNKAVDIKFKLNEKTKISIYCKNDCGWRLYASVIPGELTFQIKTFQSVCTCGKSFQHSQVNSSYVARKYLQDFGKNPKWEVSGVQFHVRQDISMKLSRNQVYRAKRKAREMLEGDEKLQYAALWDYAAMIRKTNVGNIGDPQDLNLVFISDRQKGLVPAFKKLFPKVEHRYCLKHIYSNFKLLFKGLELKDALWSCAAASTEREFERRMEYLKVNNISESFNAMILPARDKPILSMLEWIRVRLMTRLHTKRIGMEKYGGSVCPNVQDKLEKLKMESRSFSAMPSGYGTSQVSPCKHGVAAIYKNLEHPEDYLHDCYLKEAYLDVYSEIIHPMPGQDQWIKSGHLPPQPPHVLRPPGRPKKLRRRNPDELRNPHKVSRMNRQIKCGKCNKLGHNSRSCNAGITGETTWQRRQRLKQQKTAQGGSSAATNQGHTSSQPQSSQPPSSQPPSSQPPSSQPATRSRSQQWFSSTQPTTHAPRETWHSRASSSQPVSVRDSIARGAGSGVGRGRGATSGAGSGVGRGRGATSGAGNGVGRGRGAGMGATYGVGRGRGATYGVGSGASNGASSGRGVGRGSSSGAGRGSSSGQVSGAGRDSINGEASGASRSWTNGAAVKNLGLARTRGSGSSRPPKLPVVGRKGK